MDGITATSYLSGGTASLDVAINGLKGVMLEFIPYVAHVWLWIIVAVLGFVAIRWLVNWVRAKVFSSF